MKPARWAPRAAAALVAAGTIGLAMTGQAAPVRASAWSASIVDVATKTQENAVSAAVLPYEPAARAVTCDEARDRVASVLGRADATFGSEETVDLTTLGGDVTTLSTSSGGACVDVVLPMLRAITTCNRGYASIVSGIVSSPGAPDEGIERLATEATPACGEMVLRALVTGAHVTPRLIAIAEETARDAADPARRATAWLALGALGRLAGSRPNDAASSAHVDAVIRAALLSAKSEDRVLMLEAAGNAACVSCAGEIARSTRDPRWDVRRAATAALRFQPGVDAPKVLCERLTDDGSASVRENAAWAMRWRGDNDVERVECLVTAAATDLSFAVRKAATLSLIVLAEHSTDAQSALVHLTGERYAPEVRQMATDYAMAGGPGAIAANPSDGTWLPGLE